MNMKIYEQLKTVPQQYLKTIQAGRLKGMSDIKPQWRIETMTKVFGICGFGWKVQNVKFEYRNGSHEQMTCHCYLELFVKVDDVWSDPIVGVGGSSFIANEKNGLYTSDECEKMAYTDALGGAMKMLGMAADVYMGEASKYSQPAQATQPPAQEKSWLNQTDKAGNQTTQWANVMAAITAGKVKSIADVTAHYKLNKEVQSTLEQLLQGGVK